MTERKRSSLFVVIKKEIRSLFRDKKMLFMILLFPFLLAPCVMTVANLATRNAEQTTVFKMATNSDHDEIISMFDASDSFRLISCSKEEADDKIRNEELDLYLNEDEANNMFTLLYNSASTVSARALSVTSTMIEKMQNQAMKERLLKQYAVPYEASSPDHDLQYSDVYGNEKGSLILLLIPMVILSYCCYGVSSVAGELTIAEKERQTLDPLLATGISRDSLILGKNIVAIVSGWISGTLAFAGLLTYSLVIGNDTLRFNAQCVLMLLFIALLLAVFFSEVCILIGLKVKSFKEYQSYTSLLAILSMLPAFLALNVSFHSVPQSYYMVPLLNHTVLIKEVLTNHYSMPHFLLVIAATLIICILCRSVATREIRRKG